MKGEDFETELKNVWIELDKIWKKCRDLDIRLDKIGMDIRTK